VEHHDGRFELIDWPSLIRQSMRTSLPARTAEKPDSALPENAPVPA
jgi:hypothetical protein